MTFRNNTVRVLTIAFYLLLPVLSCSDKSENGGPTLVEGKCGLAGTMVQCNADFDCWDKGLGEVCIEDGTCMGADEPGWVCGWGRGFCDQGTTCGGDGKCTNPCNTHADCADSGQCYCWVQPYWGWFGWCRYAQCQLAGTCEMDHVPVGGTNLCRPEVLEGDCRRNTRYDCPEGYEPVGLRGCQIVDGTR